MIKQTGSSTLKPIKRKYEKVDPSRYKIQYVIDVDPSGCRSLQKNNIKDPELKKIEYPDINKDQHYFVKGKIYSFGQGMRQSQLTQAGKNSSNSN